MSIKGEIIYGIKSSDMLLNIHRLIVKYGDSLPDQKKLATIIKFIKEKDMSKGLKDFPNPVNCCDVAMDEIFETLYEIFPHPYHI